MQRTANRATNCMGVGVRIQCACVKRSFDIVIPLTKAEMTKTNVYSRFLGLSIVESS